VMNRRISSLRAKEEGVGEMVRRRRSEEELSNQKPGTKEAGDDWPCRSGKKKRLYNRVWHKVQSVPFVRFVNGIMYPVQIMDS
jgi:hypothetical protein